jgi:maltose O-acetyltransferase
MEGRRLLWRVAAVIPDFTFPSARARLLAMVGCDVPRGVGVLGHVELIGPAGAAENLRIGTGSIICPHARFWLDAPITLGKNVTVGPSALLCTATHRMGGPSRRMQVKVAARPIVIEDGAWIGLGAMILPGVRVGRGAIVGAGAVVRKDVPDNVLVAGNPAVVVRRLPLG